MYKTIQQIEKVLSHCELTGDTMSIVTNGKFLPVVSPDGKFAHSFLIREQMSKILANNGRDAWVRLQSGNHLVMTETFEADYDTGGLKPTNFN
jgi:hypothetical protein